MLKFANRDFRIIVDDVWLNLDFFSGIEPPFKLYLMIISALMLTLSFFTMTVSFSQKMRDLEWEQGCLRAMGITKLQSKKIFLYEAFCVVFTALITGICLGIAGTLLAVSLSHTLTDVPFTLRVEWDMIIFMVVIILISTYVAVRIPMKQLHAKQISSVLKGTSS